VDVATNTNVILASITGPPREKKRKACRQLLAYALRYPDSG